MNEAKVEKFGGRTNLFGVFLNAQDVHVFSHCSLSPGNFYNRVILKQYFSTFVKTPE
jgi:hypothetical protein